MRWLITNRNLEDDGFGGELDDLTFWTFDPDQKPKADIASRASWTKREMDEFKSDLVRVASKFPHPLETPPEQRNISPCLSTVTTQNGGTPSRAMTRSRNNSSTVPIPSENLSLSIGPQKARFSAIFPTARRRARPATT